MIGVFDSGLGGLTTMKELLHLLPDYDYLYLGDSGRAPYGSRGVENIKKFTEEGVEFLFSRGAKIVLIACNTASTDALRYLQKKYGNNPEKKVLGVLVPAVEKALENSRYGRIGIVGTTSTIKAGNYEKEIIKKSKEVYKPQEKKSLLKPRVNTQSCPLLVPLIEEGWSNKPETKMILRKYLYSLKSANIDTLILGCTHYSFLEKLFARKMGKNCKLINSGKAQAEKFVEYLDRHTEYKDILSKNKKRYFFTSDNPEKFVKLGESFLGSHIRNIERVDF